MRMGFDYLPKNNSMSSLDGFCYWDKNAITDGYAGMDITLCGCNDISIKENLRGMIVELVESVRIIG